MTLLSHSTDLQATSPSIALGLDEVGVTGVVRGIVLGEQATPATATFDVATSLGAEARGAHMSRFHEAIDHALDHIRGFGAPGLRTARKGDRKHLPKRWRSHG